MSNKKNILGDTPSILGDIRNVAEESSIIKQEYNEYQRKAVENERIEDENKRKLAETKCANVIITHVGKSKWCECRDQSIMSDAFKNGLLDKGYDIKIIKDNVYGYMKINWEKAEPGRKGQLKVEKDN